MKVSAASVRRWIDQAIRDRRLDAPDRYAHVQVARLSKMLCALNSQLERGDMRAVPPMIKVVAALDRYHGFDARYRRLALPVLAPASVPAIEATAPLALTHAPAEASPADVAEVAYGRLRQQLPCHARERGHPWRQAPQSGDRARGPAPRLWIPPRLAPGIARG